MTLAAQPQAAFPFAPTQWRVSAAWLAKPHDCTLRGIMARCGAACCKGTTYWPPRTGGDTGHCPHLGPGGCQYTPADRPVTCLLYPLVLNASGTLVLHSRATTQRGICKGNHGRGEPLVVVLEAPLVALFGAAQYARVRAAVLAGTDSYFVVPAAVAQAYAAEQAMAAANVVPPPRGG